MLAKKLNRMESRTFRRVSLPGTLDSSRGTASRRLRTTSVGARVLVLKKFMAKRSLFFFSHFFSLLLWAGAGIIAFGAETCVWRLTFFQGLTPFDLGRPAWVSIVIPTDTVNRGGCVAQIPKDAQDILRTHLP